MKARKLLASFLALCMVVSMIPIASISVSAASNTLGEDRLTHYDILTDKIDATTAVSVNGESRKEAGDGENPNKIFDNDLGSKLGQGVTVSADNPWTITFTATEPITVTCYTFGTANDSPERDAKTWKFYGSTDGTEWNVISSVENYTFVSDRKVYVDDDFRIAAPAAYTFYKLEITDFRGGASCYAQFSELVLSGYDYSAVVAVEQQINAIPSSEDEGFAAAVSAARTAYNDLGALNAQVQNYATLVVAEKEVAMGDCPEEDKAVVGAAIDAIDAIGTASYKSKNAIEAAEAAFAAVPETSKQYVSNAADLTTARNTYDALINDFNITITAGLWGRNDGVAYKWVPNQTEDEWTATKAAIVDTIKYQYSRGWNMGFTNGKEYTGGMGTWMGGVYRFELDGKPSDNVAFPMHDRNAWSATGVPFAGMAFAIDSYVAETWDFPTPISEPIRYEGKTYQVNMGNMIFYDTKEYVNSDRTDTKTSFNRWGFFPGSGDFAANIGYTMRYVYAKYNMDNKWEDKNVGIPSDNAAKIGTETYIQHFFGPDGTTYMFTTDTLAAPSLAITIDAETTAAAFQPTLENSAYIINGDLAVAIDNTEEFMAKCGDIVSVEADKITFTNGVLTADGFAETDAAAAARVSDIIAALPDAADVIAANEDAIEGARAKYDEISDGAKALVTNLAHLTEAEAALADILAGPEDAINMVKQIADLYPITYKSMPAIEAAQAAYDALSDESKAWVSNNQALADAPEEFTKVINAYAWAAKTERPGASDKVNINNWAYTCPDDIWTATTNAVTDAVKYQYSKGLQVDGDLTGDYDAWMTDAHGFWHIKLENGADNYNKQDWRNRFTTAVAMLPGMAFVVDSAFAQNWGFESASAIGEAFDFDGTTYQVMWDETRSYTAQTPSPDANAPTVTKVGFHPDERANNTETAKNIFRFAYAKYSQDNRWDGLTLGVPQSDFAKANGDYRIQEFNGPQGYAYLITTAEMIDAAPTDMTSATYAEDMANAYFIINGGMADTIGEVGNFLDICGDAISITADKLEFTNATVTVDGIDWNYADYTAVDEALATVPEDLTDYSDVTAQAVADAVDAVVRDMLISDQAEVDAMAQAITDAVNGLISKSVEMAIDISDGLVTDGAAEGVYDITWNATLTAGEGTSIDAINEAGVTVKSYGVYYATKGETLEDYKNASATDIRQKIIAEGEDVEMYTNFSFRLKGVHENFVRAAMFYMEYEFEGNSYIILSTVSEVVAVIPVVE